MCGIAGIISNNTPIVRLHDSLSRMQKALLHRGPDDQGVYVSLDKAIGLAHTRLSIIDLSDAGHQPMPSSENRFWIVFNGEIYNYKEIRSRLESKGFKFSSHTDTEVILKLYEEKRTACLEELRGMFAFAIWDDLEKTCFIARDHFGVKPLYYYESAQALIFSSELRPILASGLVAKEIDANALFGYLRFGFVAEPHTMVKGVSCLEAGHWLLWKNGELTKNRYWQINFPRKEISALKARELTRSLLSDSIDYHFTSDVPVGVFLSGGIDSSSIVALADQKKRGQLKTYSIIFEESEDNDGVASKIIADKFNTKHTELQLSAGMAKTMFPDFLNSIDQPSIDGFNTYCISRLAHENQVKVALSGLGGDELFAGAYRSFQVIPGAVSLSRKLKFLTPIYQRLGKILVRYSKHPKAERTGELLQKDINSKTIYNFLRSSLFCSNEADRIIDYYFPGVTYDYKPELEIIPGFPSLEDEISFLELSFYMRNQLLRDSDVMSMRWGLELRVPFIDRYLFEGIASIPSSIRLDYGKKLLIKAVSELPDEVFKRAKRGFTFPYQRWMSKEWSNYLKEVRCPEGISLESWYRRMCLIVFHSWWERL